MIMDKENWESFVEGFHVVGGAIGFDNSRYCFLLEEDGENLHRDPPPDLRLLYARMERSLEEGRFFSADFNDFDFTSLCYGVTAGIEEFVAVDRHGDTIVYGAWENELDVRVEKPAIDTSWHDGEQRASIPRVKRVNGRIYAVCRDRLLLERRGPRQWVEFPGLERPKELLDEETYPLDFGFNDLDAFGESDVYAVGGSGDVWRYDGKLWKRCDFPSNERLRTVCCAGDGNVYISGNMGSLWTGRGDRWKKLADGEHTVSFNDTVWFAGRLWCANDYGLFDLGDKGFEPAQVPADTQLTARRLDVSPDGTRLLSAGNHGASVFDGKEWQLLFSDLDMDD